MRISATQKVVESGIACIVNFRFTHRPAVQRGYMFVTNINQPNKPIILCLETKAFGKLNKNYCCVSLDRLLIIIPNAVQLTNACTCIQKKHMFKYII